MIRYIIYLCLMLLPLSVAAQKACVIADAETHVPIKEALIHTDNGVWARTDYRGYFTIKYPFDSAEVSKKGYVKTRIYFETLPDSVFLLPEAQQLGTVEVWGKNQEHIRDMEKQITKDAAETPRAVTGIGFDLMGIFDRQGRRDAKHRKKAKKIISELDEQGDPIIDAYENATGKEYQGKEDENAPQSAITSEAPAAAPATSDE